MGDYPQIRSGRTAASNRKGTLRPCLLRKITGTKSDRPEFQKLLQEIETGDTLVVTKLDRFVRSTQDALNRIKLLFEKGCSDQCAEFRNYRKHSTGRLIFTVFSAFADFEHGLIVWSVRRNGMNWLSRNLASRKGDQRNSISNITLTRNKRKMEISTES